MNDTSNNVKATIADQIHRAVSSLIETELRLNRELGEAHKLLQHRDGQISALQERLATEEDARRELERRISMVAEAINGKVLP